MRVTTNRQFLIIKTKTDIHLKFKRKRISEIREENKQPLKGICSGPVRKAKEHFTFTFVLFCFSWKNLLKNVNTRNRFSLVVFGKPRSLQMLGKGSTSEAHLFFVFVRFCLRQGLFTEPWLSWNYVDHAGNKGTGHCILPSNSQGIGTQNGSVKEMCIINSGSFKRQKSKLENHVHKAAGN